MNEKRDVRMSVYFTDGEIKTLAKSFNIELPIEGQTKLKKMASMVRSIALGKKISVKTISPIAREQFAELSRLSSNLNQLSHATNAGKNIDFDELRDLTNKLRAHLLCLETDHEI
jgi:hypothetical protein